MPKVLFIPSNIEVEAQPDSTILELAQENDIAINCDCGGNCACCSCHVIIMDGMDKLQEADMDEADMLDDLDERSDNSRLACQTKVITDLTVSVPVSE